eukprot:gene4870-5509_t
MFFSVWKQWGYAEPGELSMDKIRVLNNKEGPTTGQLLSPRVRKKQRVAVEQINSHRQFWHNFQIGIWSHCRLVFKNVGRFGTATLTENIEAPTRKPKQMPRTTQIIKLHRKRNPRLAAWCWRRNKKGYMPLKMKIKNLKKMRNVNKRIKNRDSVPGPSGFRTNGGKKLLASKDDNVESNVQRDSKHAMQGKGKTNSRALSFIYTGIRTSDTDTDVSDGEEYHKPGSAVWIPRFHSINHFKKALSVLLINGKPEPLPKIASLPIQDTESEENVDENFLCDKDFQQDLISSSNGETELVEPEVLIKQIYVKEDSLPTTSSGSVSEWKQKMNWKQSLTVGLALTSADTGIECDGSIDTNLNQPLQTTSKNSNKTWVDAASPTTSFQIPKQNSKNSSLAETLKECKIDIPLHANECDEQLLDKEHGNNDALQERSNEDANAKNGVKDVASKSRMENECDNNKNAFNETDVYDGVPKQEEYDDSDVESESSSIEISDIDSDDDGSLWEVSSLSSSDSFVTTKLLVSSRMIFRHHVGTSILRTASTTKRSPSVAIR